jgi:hypothetical protein
MSARADVRRRLGRSSGAGRYPLAVAPDKSTTINLV